MPMPADIPTLIAAIAALGTASFGLVDASKMAYGGASRMGYGYLKQALQPYLPALAEVNRADPLATVFANWINSVAKADQKAATKSMIRLGVTPSNAAEVARAAPGIDPAAFAGAAGRAYRGEKLSEEDFNLLSRFDAIVDVQLDAAYERADQFYRNGSKAAAVAVSVGLALTGSLMINGQDGKDLGLAVLVGLLATPIAPISKDLASALTAAVQALKVARGQG
nr:hypothetical protein [uncultured Gellertiella sp.]